MDRPAWTTRGSARIYLDGKYTATVNLMSSTLLRGGSMFTRGWSKVGRHRITVRVWATGRVDVDGFAVVDTVSAYPVLVGASDISSCSSSGDSATSALLEIPGHGVHGRRQRVRVRDDRPVRDVLPPDMGQA